jgi:hypothetical protein
MTSQKIAAVCEGANGAGPELDVTFTEQSPAHVEACERIAFGSLGGRARKKTDRNRRQDRVRQAGGTLSNIDLLWSLVLAQA